jgi:UDP-GlcNAc:undecaprenyl-phosphate/decaprenyl-phosphate GlcNAc-1-phosphate transferase
MSLPDSLRALVENGAAIWGFVAAAILVLVLTPAAVWLAPRIGGVDVPTDRPRVHSRPIPRTGGVAIVTGVLVPAVALIGLDGPYTGILLATFLVALLGLADDLWALPPVVKLAGVALLSLIPVVGSDVTFDHVTLPVIGDHDLGWVRYPLTILWITFLAHLINLIDGMDALAAGIVAIATVAFAILATSFGHHSAAALALIVCGATLAFLRHNYHPARIFMGDSGAMALGFLLACITVQGVMKTAATIALVAPMLVLAVPILDTGFVVLKRLKYRRAFWDADQNHFYHRFMRIGFSQRRTAAYLHLWAAMLACYAILARFVPARPGGEWDFSNSVILLAVGLLVVAASIWIVYTLEILKARHLEALGLRRFVVGTGVESAQPPPEPATPDEEDTLEHAITARVR